MFRLLATLILLTAFVLGQGGHGSFAATAVVDKGAVLAAVDDTSGDNGQDEHDGCPGLLHEWQHPSCSPGFLVKARFIPVQTAARFAATAPVNERDPRSIILKRDPPIPRPLI